MSFSAALFPRSITRYVRLMAWLSLIVQVGIVVTGAAVRLTASGLGCPQWPTCNGESIVTTPELGIHGFIEFANRLLTFVLVLVSILAFASVVRMRRARRDLFWITLLIGLGIPAQAVIGGVSVWMKLNPYVVGTHFLLSAALVVLATLLVERTLRPRSETWLGLSGGYLVLGWFVGCVQLVTVVMGVLTTGSGPHAGDAAAPRNGLNSELLQHLHSYPAYVAVSGVVILAVIAFRHRTPRVWVPALVLLGVNIAQIVVGIAQSRLGLPPLLVGTHMLLACLVIAATTHLIYRMTGWPNR